MTDKRFVCNNTFPTISWIPVVEDCVNSATEITKVLEYAKYPKLLKDQLWTKAVPYKYWSTYTKPSEGIGSIYTPTSAQYRVNTLTKKKKPLDCLPFGVKNKLRMPPREYIELYKEERRRKITRKFKQERNILSKNIINLKDLADGSWSRRKAEKEANQNIENKELLKEQKNKLKKNIPGKEILRNNEVEMPRSIEDQLEELMIRVEEEQNRKIRDEDIERLLYLRNECIADHHLEPYNYDNIENAKKFIIGRLRKCEDFNGIIKKLEGEIIDDYKKSLCYSIVNYILLDADERKRLLIETMPIEYPVLVIRAPVPWHQYKILAEHFMEHNLFITNEILKDIRDLWFSKYYNIMILQIQDLGTFPVAATEIESKINELCNNAVNILTKKWLADVADIFFKKKYAWSGLFEKELHASTSLIEKYFRAVNSLLSRQLRIMVLKTIQHLRNFFMQYRTGNYYEGDYEDMMFIKPPFITVNVEVEVGTMSVCCKPSILDIHTIISRCFNKILNVAMVLPKIEVILFPELDQKGFLFSISRYEDEVLMLITDTLDTISAHIPGPREYLKCYDDLLYIIDGRAKKNLDDFFNIQPFPVLREFEQKIVSYDNLSKEISMFRYKIPLNMIEIDCTIVNDIMRQILHELRTKICDFFADELRLNNRELCSIFDEIAENISKMPETTQEVVELYNYLCESRDTTMFNLKTRLARSTELTLFLFNYQPLTDEDIQLNSRTITWPKEMENIMDLATTRLNMRKEFLESVLRTRRDNFEKKINTMQIAIERFKRKDPPVLTMEEMERATEEVEQLSKDMADIRKEAEEINEEETLLEIELSPYMTIPAMSSIMDVFNKLWHIALNFYKNYEKWFYGSFVGLDADEIREEVDEIWRTLYKLSRVLSDIPGARRVAEMVRAKVEKFQQFIPVLQTICTPGLEARHWEQISEIVKVPIEISDTSCLFDMIEYGLSIHIEKLEEISSAATKEHALLKNLQKMKSEWAEIYFELTLYRDTGVNILTAIDDIQMLLDDHILTAQTMRGSVFVKAFERDMQAWEEKLIMMQDIIDQWLTCQATWMYLEPIFSSEDIMRQMPTEAKNFRRIDKIWRNIMTYVTNNTRVIDATTKPNMLQEFMLCNTLLEEIQKGLNDYLEKKRLFFPRFFFLSNDELLEILSETKDPQRVQPHLKKCFEGINKLRFTKEEDIIGMLSSEEEYVPFSGKIYPADAKGMVERWLCQVEELMIASLRDIAEQSLISYFETVREEWILSWPGQIIICFKALLEMYCCLPVLLLI